MKVVLNKQNPDFIFQTKFWVVLLAWKQVYPRLVIFAKADVSGRHYRFSSELPLEYIIDYQLNIIQKIEPAFMNLFANGIREDIAFNYFRLMNEAYKFNPPCPFVHEHLRVRLRNPISIAGFEYADPDFGFFPPREREKQGSKIDGNSEQRSELIKTIQLALR